MIQQTIQILSLVCLFNCFGAFKWCHFKKGDSITRAKSYTEKNIIDIAPFDCIKGAEFIDGPQSVASSKADAMDIGEGSGKHEISFTIYGEPIPLSRHRTVSGGLRTYNPSAGDQKNFAKACISAGVLPPEPIEGPVEAIMTFYFSRPKSHYRTGRFAGQLKEGQNIWHSKKKDLDNLVKFVLDSLNSLAYVDDGQVCAIRAMKLYTEDNPRSEVIFRTLASHDMSQTKPSKEEKGHINDQQKILKNEDKRNTKTRKRVIRMKEPIRNGDIAEGELRGFADIFACSS